MGLGRSSLQHEWNFQPEDFEPELPESCHFPLEKSNLKFDIEFDLKMDVNFCFFSSFRGGDCSSKLHTVLFVEVYFPPI